MAAASTAFRVEGIEPQDDITWHLAAEDTRRAFWRQVVTLTLDAFDAERAAGLDRFGSHLIAITAYTRRHRRSAMGQADPNAPPLTPAYGLSRTRSYVRGRAFADHAEFHWVEGWGKILRLHATGRARGGKVRDVMGISPASLAAVKRKAAAWWAAWKRGHRLELTPTRIEFVAPAAVVKPQGLPEPRKIKLVGRTDIENATFGIGGGSSRDRAAASIKAGLHTGYFQFRVPPPATGGVASPRREPSPVGGNARKRAARVGTPAANAATPPGLPPRFAAPPPIPAAPAPAPRPTPKPAPKPPARPANWDRLPPDLRHAVAVAEAHGIKVEPNGRAHLLERGHGPEVVATYSPADRAIYLNEWVSHWLGTAGNTERLHEVGWWASPDRNHLIHHEIGHALHHKEIGTAAYNGGSTRGAFTPAQEAMIEGEVSRYASTSRVEFVAEVYAALKAGKVYSDAIMALYRNLRGPKA